VVKKVEKEGGGGVGEPGRGMTFLSAEVYTFYSIDRGKKDNLLPMTSPDRELTLPSASAKEKEEDFPRLYAYQREGS